MKEIKTLRNLIVLYKMAKKLKGDTGIFRFHLLNEFLRQEMDCIIDAFDIMQFVTMQEISAVSLST